MGLSRLDNFLKNTKGEILYVDPNSLDSTDSVDNQGNSLARPFKTIQRALIEAARFSYQRGLDNDRFGRTTILLYPGDHIVDNRPGWIPTTTANTYRLRSSATSGDLSPFDATTNFDLTTENNILYKLNSIHGGVIVPRGTSIVGLDLRKTKIRPKYVPNPENDQIERSAIFRVTGSCYLWQFTVLDADPNGLVYKDYTTNTFVPNFSHHKLTAFEYADGVNNVKINDDFISGTAGEFTKTDLDMYYQKVGAVYGTLSGRTIFPETVGNPLDIQTKIDEYRIVGSTGAEVGISSIRSGDGVTPSTSITVTLSSAFTELDVDTPIRIAGVDSPGYDGQYVVSEVLSSTVIKYNTSSAPTNPLPASSTLASATLNINVDTVTSASPYIFNVSLRSVFGMCGLHADGSKAGGFKSMVVAQFTGIGLQKDNNAFVKYNATTGLYEDRLAAGNANISTNSRARFKPSWENYHIKASNNSFIQNVSIFAIGFANHFVAETGGDMSITNSNSNFGARSLFASGFRKDAFLKDDHGYITHVIPPREIESSEVSVEFDAIDVGVTTSVSAGAATTSRLYLYNQTNRDNPPDHVIDGYRIGAKENDKLNVLISTGGISTSYTSRIIIPNTTVSSENSTTVFRSVVGINSIASNVVNLNSTHTFTNGEKIRVLSDNGHLPDGIKHNTIYYCITEDTTTPLAPNQIKIAQTYNDAINNNPVTINSKGGSLTIVSRVSDKKPGDIGHPIQYDTSRSQWYINVSAASTENQIYNKILTTNISATPRTYITRKPDPRGLSDVIYKVRYVIPKDAVNARPPLDGYVLQESNSTIATSNSEIQKYFSSTTAELSTSTEMRNFRFIANASWTGGNSTIATELPHNLRVGDQVEIVNVKSSANTSGTADLGFNGTFTVTSLTSSKEFVVSLSTNPGTFTSDTTTRTTALPYFKRKKHEKTFIVYRSQEVQEYVSGKQDGVYNIILVNSSNNPVVSPFTGLRLSQPIQNLYPQSDRDNPKSNPKSSTSFALSDPIGQVVLDDPRNSATKETLDGFIIDSGIGIGITNIISNSVGTSHTIYTTVDHGFNRATKLTISAAGLGYGSGGAQRIYNAKLTGVTPGATGQNATAVINVDSSGSITAAEIMDGGGAYQVGDQVYVTGTATTTGYSLATLTVSKVYNSIGEVISIDGVKGSTNTEYNNLYRITGIGAGKTKEIIVSSASTVGNASLTGVGPTLTASANLVNTGKLLNVQSLIYSNVSGIATVVVTERHGLFADNKIKIGGANDSFYNGDFIVKSVGTSTSFTINVGINSLAPSTSGTIYVYRHGFTSYGGNTTSEDENVSGRFNVAYAGITTALLGPVTGPTISTLEIDTTGLDLRIGDYLQVEEEIMRVKKTVNSNTVTVFRGVMATPRSSYGIGTLVRRIKLYPVELRRNSIMRASGHTFEYVGFGPGNYSTALPDRQDRKLTPIEELTSQAFKEDGGINVFTGMNSDGDFYIGNKKVSSATGQEEVFDAPVPTTVGEDLGEGSLNVGFDVLTPLEATISRSIRVEGGEDNRIISRFDGPVVFNNKITSNSPKGIEASSIFIQGEATTSRKHTVGISTPTSAGNPGDVVYNASPVSGGSLGWVYTLNNRWEPFGHIGTNGVL